MKNKLVESVNSVAADIERFQLCWDQFKPKEDSLATNDSLAAGLTLIRAKRAEWDNLRVTVDKLKYTILLYVLKLTKLFI